MKRSSPEKSQVQAKSVYSVYKFNEKDVRFELYSKPPFSEGIINFDGYRFNEASKMGEQELEDVVTALTPKDCTIHVLNIRSVKFKDFSQELRNSFFATLANNTSLRVASFAHSTFPAKDMCALIEALSKNKSIYFLNLSFIQNIMLQPTLYPCIENLNAVKLDLSGCMSRIVLEDKKLKHLSKFVEAINKNIKIKFLSYTTAEDKELTHSKLKTLSDKGEILRKGFSEDIDTKFKCLIESNKEVIRRYSVNRHNVTLRVHEVYFECCAAILTMHNLVVPKNKALTFHKLELNIAQIEIAQFGGLYQGAIFLNAISQDQKFIACMAKYHAKPERAFKAFSFYYGIIQDVMSSDFNLSDATHGAINIHFYNHRVLAISELIYCSPEVPTEVLAIIADFMGHVECKRSDYAMYKSSYLVTAPKFEEEAKKRYEEAKEKKFQNEEKRRAQEENQKNAVKI